VFDQTFFLPNAARCFYPHGSRVFEILRTNLLSFIEDGIAEYNRAGKSAFSWINAANNSIKPAYHPICLKICNAARPIVFGSLWVSICWNKLPIVPFLSGKYLSHHNPRLRKRFRSTGAFFNNSAIILKRLSFERVLILLSTAWPR